MGTFGNHETGQEEVLLLLQLQMLLQLLLPSILATSLTPFCFTG